ncbi:MAG TPA: chemotaxis protein CheB [Mycobacteriales bacterium]|nr:chemotaxis protein CheB [Mycobacteriales bacterium]
MSAAVGATIRTLLVPDPGRDSTELVRLLQREGDIAVVAQADGAGPVLRSVSGIRPHVVVLDLHAADSLLVIEQIMATVPTPILVLSSPTDDRRSPAVTEALVAGALEALPVPGHWTAAQEHELRRAVRQIRKVPVIRHPRGRVRVPPPPAPAGDRHPVVGLAASTGGPSALATVLAGLGGLRAPVLVVQHLHPDFTSGLVDWLVRVSALPVEVARSGQPAAPGRAYLAPGGRHLRLGPGGRLELTELPASLHRPSADELFGSLAEQAGAAATGVLLTGMGEDGARGLLALHRAGGCTFAQDEATSAVFGMPQAAYRMGAVTGLLPLDKIAAAVHRAVSGVRA